MRDQPDATRLLEQAHATLLGELIDALPRDRRYTALLVANALAIALRELQSGREVAAAELLELRVVLPDKAVSDLGAMERALASRVRDGRCGGDSEVYQYLLASCSRRLGITSPKYLKREGFDL